jgi:hypothetical protein
MPLSRAALAIRESKTFETVGSKTGKRYRIKQGNQQNVFELNETGQPSASVTGHGEIPGPTRLVSGTPAVSLRTEATQRVSPFSLYHRSMILRSMTRADLEIQIGSHVMQARFRDPLHLKPRKAVVSFLPFRKRV